VIVGESRNSLAAVSTASCVGEGDVTQDPKEGYCDGEGRWGVEKYVDVLRSRVV